MAVTALAQRLVLGAAGGVALGCNARPMVDGVAEAWMAGVSSNDLPALARPLGDWSNSAQGAQSSVVSPLQGVPSLCEQRGERDPSDAWQGVEDRGVALLDDLPRGGLLAVVGDGRTGKKPGEAVELCMSVAELAIDKAKTFDERADVRHGGLGGTRRDANRLSTQQLDDLS